MWHTAVDYKQKNKKGRAVSPNNYKNKIGFQCIQTLFDKFKKSQKSSPVDSKNLNWIKDALPSHGNRNRYKIKIYPLDSDGKIQT